MRISTGERKAIKRVLNAGASYGFGNMIAHLQTAWAADLVRQGLDEKTARHHAGPGFPFAMQRDLLQRRRHK